MGGGRGAGLALSGIEKHCVVSRSDVSIRDTLVSGVYGNATQPARKTNKKSDRR